MRSVEELKAKLREELRAQRQGRDAKDHARRSEALREQLAEWGPYRSARSIAAFVGVRGEPDTSMLLQAWLARGRELWLPRVHVEPGSGLMTFEQVRDLDELVDGPMGLREPAPVRDDGDTRFAHRVEVILVPGLAFDRSGARLGQGGGYYDRALKGLGKTDPVRVGLCFADELRPEGETLPIEDHDARVHVIVTDEGVIDLR